MNPDRLTQSISFGLERFCPGQDMELSARLGRKLREQYLGLVRGFRDIVACANPQYMASNSGVGTVWTSPINLGSYKHPEAGEITGLATINLKEYNHNMRRTSTGSFRVETLFSGRSRNGISTLLEREHFGGALYGDPDYIPIFVKNPDTGCEEPYDIGEEIGFRYPLSRTWTMGNYRELALSLRPMMLGAADTQRLLIGCMQDPQLNPTMAQAAAELTLPEPISIGG